MSYEYRPEPLQVELVGCGVVESVEESGVELTFPLNQKSEQAFGFLLWEWFTHTDD